MSTEKFKADLEQGYSFEGESITLGAGMLGGAPITGCHVKIPLKTMNCLLYTSPSPRDRQKSRMPSSA